MKKAAGAVVLFALMVAGAAQAEPVAYSWTGMGTVVPGSSKCQTYRMTVDVTVDGDKVKGTLQQQGREQRQFEGTKDKSGLLKTKAVVGGEGTLDITLMLQGDEGRILLEGYCKFEGKLSRK